MNIVASFLKTLRGSQYNHAIADRYFKLARAALIFVKTATHIANLYFDLCLVSYVILTYLLSDNRMQFVREIFTAVCTPLGVRHVATTLYHPHKNDQAEQFAKIILIFIWLYEALLQKNQQIFGQPLTNAYNTQFHCSTQQTHFSLVLSRHPPGHTLLEAHSTLSTDSYAEISTQVLQSRLDAGICTLQKKIDKNMAYDQQH